MPRSNGSKMAAVERDHDVRVQALGERDHRSVRSTQRKVRILQYKLADSRPIVRPRALDVVCLEPGEKRCLGAWSPSAANEVAYLGNGERRDDKGEITSLEDSQTALVIVVVRIDDRV
ncbi:MAG: hypothetical protein QOF51_3727 [Chloroflexota bacterium]|jgi:hypothetical protein|nr:hypothetical protein [Chloroflexota bacterium]